MRVLEAVPEVACLTGVIYPIGALHLAAQPLPAEVRQVLAEDLAHSLNRYLDSGLYRSRWMRLKKWKDTGGRLRDLRGAWHGGRMPEALVYKEPFLSLAPTFVYEALPEARFVYLLRDGRDCAASLVRSYDVLTDAKLRHRMSTEARMGRPYDDRIVPWWVGEGEEDLFMSASPYVRAAWMWRFMVLRCQEAFQRPEVRASERVLEVRYERLMQDPEGEGERIARHLGFSLGPTARRHLRAAHVQSIGNYKRWDPAEVAEAERVIGDALQLTGYLPEYPVPVEGSPRQVLEAAIEERGGASGLANGIP